MNMRARFVIILSVFAVTLGYVLWHLWRITPGGRPVKLTVTGDRTILRQDGYRTL